MKNISNILEEKSTSRDNRLLEEITADDIAHIKFVPLTSVDVERSLLKLQNNTG